jgi:hypothetical protein
LAYVLDAQDPERHFYRVPSRKLALIYDWDFGGLYEPHAPFGELRNARTMRECAKWSACGRNSKADAFTLLSTLWWNSIVGNELADSFPRVQALLERSIKWQLMAFASAFGLPQYGGFEYRLCKGPLPDACPGPQQPVAQLLQQAARSGHRSSQGLQQAARSGHRSSQGLQPSPCEAPWEPPDCWMLTPLAMLQDEVFAPWRYSAQERHPPVDNVYGLWPDDETKEAAVQELLGRRARGA